VHNKEGQLSMTQDNNKKRLNFNNSTLFPNLESNQEKMESLKKFEQETHKLFKIHQKKRHLGPKRYRKQKQSKYNFDARDNSHDIFNAKEQQLHQF